MKQRNLEEVKALSEEEAVEIVRQAGILGAGGGGFPTYFKCKNPQPHLIVNAKESEPGYWADKVMHKEYLDEFLKVYKALKTIFGFEQVTMCIHEKDREWYADYDGHDDGVHDVRCVPDKYALGASMTEVLGIVGMDVENSGHLSVIDGGPYLNEMGIEEFGTGDGYVRQMTNTLLLIPKGTKRKDYADVETQPPEEGIVSLVGELSGARMPLGGRYLEPAEALVSAGDEVEYEQKIGEPWTKASR